MTDGSQYSERGMINSIGITHSTKPSIRRDPPYPQSYANFKQTFRSSIQTTSAVRNPKESLDNYLLSDIPRDSSHAQQLGATQNKEALRNSLFVDTEMTLTDLAPPSGLAITQSIRKPRIRSALNRNNPQQPNVRHSFRTASQTGSQRGTAQGGSTPIQNQSMFRQNNLAQVSEL